MKPNQEDKIISEFLKSLGPWQDIVVVGGGFALFISPRSAEPAVRAPRGARRTLIASAMKMSVSYCLCPTKMSGFAYVIFSLGQRGAPDCF